MSWTCPRCLEAREDTERLEDRRYCKRCNIARVKSWTVANAERVAALRYARYERQKPAELERRRRYNAENRERIRVVRAAYLRRLRQRQGERVRAYRRDYYRRNLERVRAAVRRYQQRNPEVVNAKIQRRRARASQALGSFTPGEWQALCAAYGHRCLACGRQVRLTVDHVIPLTKGGSNAIDNIQPLCVSCNARKRDRIMDFRPR